MCVISSNGTERKEGWWQGKMMVVTFTPRTLNFINNILKRNNLLNAYSSLHYYGINVPPLRIII